MNKSIILSFLVLCVVLAGAGWYLLRNNTSEDEVVVATSTSIIASSTPPKRAMQEQAVLVGEPSFPATMVDTSSGGGASALPKGTQSTISDLLTKGGDQICSVVTNTSDVQSKGVIYISGKKVRGIFTSKVVRTNTIIDSNFVQSDGWVYSWSSLMSQGFKAPTAKNQVIPISDAYSFEYDQGIEYRCNSWTVDSSFFQLPTWIKFVASK